MTRPGASAELLDGDRLREAFRTANTVLRESAAAVDAINVYPVPDGDTGTNMAGTLREAVDATLVLSPSATVPEVLAALARGALYGARGNSGVILSQALKGLAAGAGDREQLDAAGLAAGLAAAADAAYRAVSKPAEGTMLTVLRASGAAAQGHAATLENQGDQVPCVTTLQAAVAAAEEAEARTPEQLPALAEAGVTDAGGEGICVILRGLLAGITGRAAAPVPMPARAIAAMAGHERDDLGFCTEFVLEPAGARLDQGRVRSLAGAHGNRSVVVVGDEAAMRVHAHSDDPEALIAAARALGRVTRVKVEDMAAQNVRFGETGSGAGAGVAVLALSHGAGFNAVFESLGASVFPLGTIGKPPSGELAAAADALRKADVIILPNHKNVLLAAQQAVALAGTTLHVVPTSTLPQGLAAALAFDPGESVAANVRAMADSARSVRTVEVTIAASSRSADGVQARAGETLALVDDVLVASEPGAADALLAGLRHAGAASRSLVTLYGGEDLEPGTLGALADAARAALPGVEVEVIDGGQSLYPIIASVE